MKKTLGIVVALAIAAFVSGCNQQTEPVATEEPDVTTATTAEPVPEGDVDTEVEMVVVPAEGTEFDPPVEVVQIPDGVWYCDMGTVHYASGEEGDGRCPVCGMYLKQKGAEDEGAEMTGAEETEEGADAEGGY